MSQDLLLVACMLMGGAVGWVITYLVMLEDVGAHAQCIEILERALRHSSMEQAKHVCSPGKATGGAP